MHSRRGFLGAVAAASLTSSSCSVESVVRAANRRFGPDVDPELVARDEDFWAEIQRAFTVDRSLLNLNNGGVSPAPAFVQDAMRRHLEYANSLPSRNLWHVQQPQRETVRARLASAFGSDPDEIAMTRNTSESLQTCQFGFDLRQGDEVLCTELDYPRMIRTFEQRERRDGIKLVKFAIPTPNDDLDAVTELYRKHITERTKLILVSHVISVTGQIMPVRDVVMLGRARGIPVIVDGAHSFAHLDFKLADLECDYYGTSLHKWLCAPHGTGMLFVRRDKIGGVWPLMAASEALDDDIRKFEEIGTCPHANTLAIAEALTFHETIGPARKLARLRYLRDYWAERVMRHDRVKMLTSLKPDCAAGFASFWIEEVDSRQLSRFLWRAHKISTTGFGSGAGGLRVSPHVYNTLPELDRFCSVIDGVVRDGIPS